MVSGMGREDSLCSGGFTDATTDMCWFGVCWGHDTDVSRTGCTRLGSLTRRVSFYVSLVGGDLRLFGPSSGTNGSVGAYHSIEVSCERYDPTICRCIRT